MTKKKKEEKNDIIQENKKKEAPKRHIVKKTIRINIGKIIDLIKGQELPYGIDENFYSSLKKDGII